MFYEFCLGSETKIYEGVIASRTADGMSLTITTNRPVEETLRAIQAGVDAAQVRLDQEQTRARQYAHMVQYEFAKEDVSPFFDEKSDAAFVKYYLKAKTDGFFKGDPNAFVFGAQTAHDYSENMFSEYGITNKRPRFEVTLELTEEGQGSVFDFLNNALPDVFTAPLAVGWEQNQGKEGRLKFEVRGNPARLIIDILDNDPTLAAVVAQRMGL